MNYAGFWPRLAANLLDVAIFVPMLFVMLVASDLSRLAYFIAHIIGISLGAVVQIWLVYRYGGSPGKLIMGLRVRMLNGEPVTGRAALLRHSVNLTFGILSAIATALALASVTEAQYMGVDSFGRSRFLDEHRPFWSGPLTVLMYVWTWGELLVLLTNRKRRALHDFIAGTVVIQMVRRPAARAEPQGAK